MQNPESRIVDPDTEWSLSHKTFREVLEIFGPFKINLFAFLNNKCKSYVSWFPDSSAIVVDALTLSWEDWNFYAFSPFILLPCSEENNGW